MADTNRLERLGYKQELTRSFTRLTNYGMTLSVISITAGITTLFSYGMHTGGPAVMFWGWFVVSIFTLFVGLGLAEICSAYPTAGGLYYWTANLVPLKHRPLLSWYTGWFNLIGQLSCSASVSFGLSLLIGSVISISLESWSPKAVHIVLIHLFVVTSYGLFNSLGNKALLYMTHVSTWWQLIAPTIVTITLLVTGRGEHRSIHFVLFTYVNSTGWSSIIYVCLIGLLQAQYCLSGYDSAAHISEETKKADVAGPLGMVAAIVGSSILGWLFIFALCFGINDYSKTMKTKTGFPVTQILMDNVGRSWTIVLMSGLLLAIWFCGLACVTATSRMIYAFSRDEAMPFSRVWLRVNQRLSCPLNAVWLTVIIAGLLGLPYLVSPTAFTAITSVCTICLYTSYGIPLGCKIISSTSSFMRGPFHLGRYSTVNNVVAVLWILLIVVLFTLPAEYPVTWVNMNYASVAFLFILFSTSMVFLFSARFWFRGPRSMTNVHQQSTCSFKLEC